MMRVAALTVMVAAGCTGSRKDPSDTLFVRRDTSIARPAGAVVRDTTPVASSSGLDQSELIVLLRPPPKGNTPADLLVVNPRGERTGFDPATRAAIAQIRQASYDSAPPSTQTDEDPEPESLERKFMLVTPAEGRYEVDVVGHGTGRYTLEVRMVAPSGLARIAVIPGRVSSARDVHRYEITYARADTAAPVVTRIP
jgi:hypothetical protein